MAKRVLIPLPSQDFDPTETAVPWKILSNSGIEIIFATPTGTAGQCDQRMLRGIGLGPLSKLFAADHNGRESYEAMSASEEFKRPIKWGDIDPTNFDGLVLPGGHARGMREYLESSALQRCTSKFFELSKPVGAICHGVVLASRSQTSENRSVLFGRKTTALLASQELIAWLLTCIWLGNYYRTYSQTVEAEVKSALESSKDFIKGTAPLSRDDAQNLSRGFVVRDKNYLSARWPGDAHLFGNEFLKMLN
jgi:protease I